MAKRPTAAEKWAGDLLADVERQANMAAGLDLHTTERALDYAVKGLMLQAKALSELDYNRRTVKADCPECGNRVKLEIEGGDPQVLSRALSHTSKMLDDVTRLREFAQGKADSRPETGADWLKLLSPEQIAIVQGWIAK